jgi:hypothetical protein
VSRAGFEALQRRNALMSRAGMVIGAAARARWQA